MTDKATIRRILLIGGALLLPFILTALYWTVVIRTNIGDFTLEYHIDRVIHALVIAIGTLCLWKLIKNKKSRLIIIPVYIAVILVITAFFAWGFTCQILRFNCM